MAKCAAVFALNSINRSTKENGSWKPVYQIMPCTQFTWNLSKIRLHFWQEKIKKYQKTMRHLGMWSWTVLQGIELVPIPIPYNQMTKKKQCGTASMATSSLTSLRQTFMSKNAKILTAAWKNTAFGMDWRHYLTMTWSTLNNSGRRTNKMNYFPSCLKLLVCTVSRESFQLLIWVYQIWCRYWRTGRRDGGYEWKLRSHLVSIFIKAGIFVGHNW